MVAPEPAPTGEVDRNRQRRSRRSPCERRRHRITPGSEKCLGAEASRSLQRLPSSHLCLEPPFVSLAARAWARRQAGTAGPMRRQHDRVVACGVIGQIGAVTGRDGEGIVGKTKCTVTGSRPDFGRVAGGGRTENRTPLSAVVQTIISPYSDPTEENDDRIMIRGPDVWIGGSAMTSLALLLHGFATNAVKYDSLAVPTGRVDVGWSVSDDDLRLVWRERGGPPINNPTDQVEGFGTLLARATVKSQLGGSISRDWEAEGLTVHLRASLARLAK
jgi:hypothetical protein